MYTVGDLKQFIKNFTRSFNQKYRGSIPELKVLDFIFGYQSEEYNFFNIMLKNNNDKNQCSAQEIELLNKFVIKHWKASLAAKGKLADTEGGKFLAELAVEMAKKNRDEHTAATLRKRLTLAIRHYHPFTEYQEFIGNQLRPENQFYVYRGDSRSLPQMIKQGGFKARLLSNKPGVSYVTDTMTNLYNCFWTRGRPAIINHSYSVHSIAFARLPHEAAAFPMNLYSAIPKDAFVNTDLTGGEVKPLVRETTWVYEVCPPGAIIDTHQLEMLTTPFKLETLKQEWLDGGSYVKEVILADSEMPYTYIRRAFQVERICELVPAPTCCTSYVPCLREFKVLQVVENPEFGKRVTGMKTLQEPCPWFSPGKSFNSRALVSAELNEEKTDYPIPEAIRNYARSLLASIPVALEIIPKARMS